MGSTSTSSDVSKSTLLRSFSSVITFLAEPRADDMFVQKRAKEELRGRACKASTPKASWEEPGPGFSLTLFIVRGLGTLTHELHRVLGGKREVVQRSASEKCFREVLDRHTTQFRHLLQRKK